MLRLGEGGGEGVKGRVLSSVFGKKPMNHQDNLVHSRRVMLIHRGLPGEAWVHLPKTCPNK